MMRTTKLKAVTLAGQVSGLKALLETQRQQLRAALDDAHNLRLENARILRHDQQVAQELAGTLEQGARDLRAMSGDKEQLRRQRDEAFTLRDQALAGRDAAVAKLDFLRARERTRLATSTRMLESEQAGAPSLFD